MSVSPPTGARTSGPRSRKGARTRARLIDAAKAVFEETGYLDVRISDIVERAGLAHGSFYHYFESKEAVFLEVAAAQGERFSLEAIVGTDVLAASVGPQLTEQLRHVIRRYFETYRAEARIIGVIEQVSRYHEPVRALRAAQQQDYVRQAEQAIAAVQSRGGADPELDPAIAASALVGMMHRFAELWFVEGSVTCSFDDGVETVAAMCARAIVPAAPPA